MKKISLEWCNVLLGIIHAITSTLSFGFDQLIQYLKAQHEKESSKSAIKYRVVAIIFGILLCGMPYISKWTGKVMKKISDKITEYINKLKE